MNEPRGGTPPAVEVENVGHSFGKRRALEDVSCTVARGEIRALIGPNGAGKSTLLRILAGLLHPHEGRSRVAGVDPAADPNGVRRRIGLMPTGERTLYYHISGFENLVFFGRLQGLRRRDAAARARELLAEVGLTAAADVHVGGYSGGMKKRLSFARAMLVEPPVLLIDEATHDLDPVGASTVRELVERAARRGCSVIWTTQRLDEIRGFADRVTMLVAGRVRFEGSVADFVSAAPRRYVVQVRNGALPAAVLLPRIEKALAGLANALAFGPIDNECTLSLAGTTPLAAAIAALAAAGIHVTSCREERAPVEQAFYHLTAGDA